MNDTIIKAILLAREPRTGYVKTRLAKVIGEEAACEIYKAMAEDTWEKMLSSRLPCWLSTDTENEWLPSAERQIIQPSGGFGIRIRAAFDEMTTSGVDGVVSLGADTPHIDPEIIKSANQLLVEGDADIVTSPSDDGGLVLLAMKLPTPIEVEQLPFETENLSSFFDRLDGGIIHRQVGPVSYDIDDVDDLKRLLREAEAGLIDAARTVSVASKYISDY